MILKQAHASTIAARSTKSGSFMHCTALLFSIYRSFCTEVRQWQLLSLYAHAG